MKSGLWILVAAIVAGVVVGVLLKPRLKSLMENREPPEAEELARIEQIGDPTARVERLRAFISKYADSDTKYMAYRMLADTIVNALRDTSGYVAFANLSLAEESDPASRAETYYWLYDVQAVSDSAAAVGVASRLLGESLDMSGIYNYVGYDLAEKGIGLDVALGLCDKALQFADSRADSAGIMDSRGWVYYKMGQYNRAVSDLEIAVELFSPPYEEILRHLAYAALRAGQSDKAFETLKTILVMGEYAYARADLDSLMDARSYSPDERSKFEQSVWDERMNEARPGEAFALPTLTGNTYAFDPHAGRVAVIDFMSPT
jgi:tetratricopeptide (TPR) repeat protein